jgi:hypothetical protein
VRKFIKSPHSLIGNQLPTGSARRGKNEMIEEGEEIEKMPDLNSTFQAKNDALTTER